MSPITAGIRIMGRILPRSMGCSEDIRANCFHFDGFTMYGSLKRDSKLELKIKQKNKKRKQFGNKFEVDLQISDCARFAARFIRRLPCRTAAPRGAHRVRLYRQGRGA